MADMMSEMGDFDDSDTEEMPIEDEMAADEPEIDAEFAMHATELGFTSPEQQAALKSAIERCVALKEEGEYAEPAEEDLDSMAALGEEDDMAAFR